MPIICAIATENTDRKYFNRIPFKRIGGPASPCYLIHFSEYEFKD